jgi:hypothetical protein
MKGFIKILATEFDAFEADALARVQSANPDPSMTAYSFARPDKDDATFVWYRVEDDLYQLMTPEEQALVVENGNFE